MYKGKRVKSNFLGKRPLLLLVSLLMLVSVSVVGTLAYLADATNPVTNTFSIGQVSSVVEEDFDGDVKNNVAVKNTGSVPVYVRAMVVATWVEVDSNGKPTGSVYPVAPAEDADYSMEWTMNGWVKNNSDGFYYYTQPIAAGVSTGELFTNCEQLKPAPADGYRLSIEILTQSIQADGMGDEVKTYQQAWAKATNS